MRRIPRHAAVAIVDFSETRKGVFATARELGEGHPFVIEQRRGAGFGPWGVTRRVLTSTRSPRGLAEILIEIVFLAGQPSVARGPSAVVNEELVFEDENVGITGGALRDGRTMRGPRGFRVRAGQHDDRVGRSHAVAVGLVPEG